MKEKMVTVVVPIYNATKYLSECIESITKQTYNNLEILLIDDGSVDGSDEICKFYESKDSRIKVIIKKNEGVSMTRNLGICEAKGEYITFVDADDIIEETMIEKLFLNLDETKADMCVCKECLMIKDKLIQSNITKAVSYNKKKNDLYETYYAPLFKLNNDNMVGHSYGILYRKELLLKYHIVFPKCKLYEDLLFMVSAYSVVEQVNIVDEALYYYRVDSETSVLRKTYHNNLLLDKDVYLTELDKRLKDTLISNKQKNNIIFRNYIVTRHELFCNAVMNPNTDMRRQEIREIKKSYICKKKIPITDYMSWFLKLPLMNKGSEILIKLNAYSLFRFLKLKWKKMDN